MRLYDVLLAETDPDLVYLEMDVYWAHVGQFNSSSRRDDGNLVLAPFDPLDYVLSQSERYPLFHIKGGVYDRESSRAATASPTWVREASRTTVHPRGGERA